MAKYVVTFYKNQAEAETYIETVDTTTPIIVVPFPRGAETAFMVITG